jgi:D-alanine-D-alanine ligase
MKSNYDPHDFGKVVVLMGGDSPERDISLISGQHILASLRRSQIDVHGIDVQEDVVEQLLTLKPDRAFIALHRSNGENGSIQGLLEHLHIPYTGSGIAASAMAMDKIYAKLIWASTGIPTPNFRLIFDLEGAIEVMQDFGFPLCIKPTSGGSSLGVSKVVYPEQLPGAFEKAAAFNGKVMIEPWIEGEEYTVSILGDEALPVVEIRTPENYYDLDAKYLHDKSQYICPTDLAPEGELELQELALTAFRVLGCKDWGRVDVVVRGGEYRFLEIDTVPGLTDHSLLPKAADVIGLSYDQLVLEILSYTLELQTNTKNA